MSRQIYAVQFWNDHQGWITSYLSSFRPDAEEALDDAVEVVPHRSLRLVGFTVPDLDFVSTHCTNYTELDAHVPEL